MVALTVNDLSGHHCAQHKTTYTYSAFDELTSFTTQLNSEVLLTTTRAYDQAGNLTRETDAANNATYYTYSAENRVIARTDRLGSTWLTCYAAYGQRISETDSNGRVTTYVHGAFGQLLGSRLALRAATR